MSEIYGLGYSLYEREGVLVVSSRLGRRRVYPSSLLTLAGVGRISSSAIDRVAEVGGLLSVRRGFRVVVIDHEGSVRGMLLRAQIAVSTSAEEGLKVAKSIVRAASLNKLWLLEELELLGYEVGEEVETIRELVRMEVSSKDALRRLEARVARSYFEGLRKVVPEKYGFEARTRRPPRDCVSAALSYAYVKLYGYLECMLLSAGLDPRIGFLHEPFRKRASLALDLAEEFKQPVVDAALLPLFTTETLSPSRDFRREGEAVYLGVRGRALVDRALRRRLDQQLAGKSFLEWMRHQVARLVDYLEGRAEEYEAFTIRRCLARVS